MKGFSFLQRTLFLLSSVSVCNAFIVPPSTRARGIHQMAALVDVIDLKEEIDLLDRVVDLSVTSFFGSLGDDFGFNNGRAIAFQKLFEEQRKDLEHSLDTEKDICLAARQADDGRVVGFVRLKNNLILDNLCVDRSMRRQGIGLHLMDALMRKLSENLKNVGTKSILVSLLVDSDNPNAELFYRAAGWKKKGVSSTTRYRVSWWRGLISEPCMQTEFTREVEIKD